MALFKTRKAKDAFEDAKADSALIAKQNSEDELVNVIESDAASIAVSDRIADDEMKAGALVNESAAPVFDVKKSEYEEYKTLLKEISPELMGKIIALAKADVDGSIAARYEKNLEAMDRAYRASETPCIGDESVPKEEILLQETALPEEETLLSETVLPKEAVLPAEEVVLQQRKIEAPEVVLCEEEESDAQDQETEESIEIFEQEFENVVEEKLEEEYEAIFSSVDSDTSDDKYSFGDELLQEIESLVRELESSGGISEIVTTTDLIEMGRLTEAAVKSGMFSPKSDQSEHEAAVEEIQEIELEEQMESAVEVEEPGQVSAETEVEEPEQVSAETEVEESEQVSVETEVEELEQVSAETEVEKSEEIVIQTESAFKLLGDVVIQTESTVVVIDDEEEATSERKFAPGVIVRKFANGLKNRSKRVIIAVTMILVLLVGGTLGTYAYYSYETDVETRRTEKAFLQVSELQTLLIAETKLALDDMQDVGEEEAEDRVFERLVDTAASLVYIAQESSDVANTTTYAAVVAAYSWSGSKLTASKGTVTGPNGKETYYNLDMSTVVSIMRSYGVYDTYWVRSDGCKMLGNYIMVAANLSLHPKGTIVKTSLGLGIVVDTGGFASTNPTQIDIATTW